MKRIARFAGGVFAVSIVFSTADAASIQWVDWQTGIGRPYSSWYSSVTGEISNGGSPITVTVTGNFIIEDTQLDGGINYWSSGNAYAEIPTNEDGLATRGAPFTISFSQPVTDPVLIVSDFDSYSRDTYWIFDTPNISILSHGSGLLGAERSPLQIDPNQANRVIGDEANGIIQFHGTFTDINMVQGDAIPFFTIGVSVVPVPAAFWLFGSGLVALAGVARRRN